MGYPRPSTPYVGHSSLYFATEQQIHSTASFGNFDRGEISVSHGSVTFRGMSVLVECPNVSEIRLVRKAFPWLVLLPIVVLAGILVYANSPTPFSWRQPLPYVIGAILLIGSLLHAREMWVEVSFWQNDTPGRAYFRDSSPLWRSARRNRELLKTLEGALLTPAEGGSADDAPDRVA